MSVGGFVRVKGTRDGVGKLVALTGTRAEIEYFVSPAAAEPERATAESRDLEVVELSPQTRVYWFDEKHNAWRTGRVDGGLVSAQALRASEDHYHVRFPNGVEARIPQSRLYVRWAHPIQEPTDYLAARITDTPFYFDGRVRALRLIAAERAAFGGLSGLASSAIELLAHQVTTVRHISADPVQRYLLADEVGLGKTIEAGVLIRQHVIDAGHDAHVLVIVPPHLVGQWRSELSQKFFLDERHGVYVVSEAELGDSHADLSMLVIDEAHRTALRAYATLPAEQALFEQARVRAARTHRVLLLSGTPVVHREDGFLAMLHLLDPDGYSLDGIDAFRRRVQGRQIIAEAVADLGDDASAFFIEDALSRLEELFAEDSRLRQLCGAVRELASADVGDEKRLSALRSLRSHISETYRLHRRLIRTRRDDPRVRELLPQRVGAVVLQHECQARKEAADLLEAWRASYSGQPSSAGYDRLFALLVESAISHPAVLVHHIDARLRALSTSKPAAAGQPQELQLPSAFASEASLLSERRILIEAALEEDSRCDRLAQWLRMTRDARKVVVFVDERAVADSLVRLLSQKVGGVLRHGTGANTEDVFSNSEKARVLVCDAGAEEGLNLQRIGAVVVHYDLPLDPARIEQRIGRVDRVEAKKNVQSVVFSSDAPYEREWLHCLRDAIRVFERSVAPLQYVLVDETSRIRASLISEGPAAIEATQARMGNETTGLDAELKRIRAQEALDAAEHDPEAERAFFEALQDADLNSDERGAAELDAWLVDRLQFMRRDDDDGGFRYIHSYPTSRRPTLLPLFETITRFGTFIDRDPKSHASRAELPFRRATFERATAEDEGIDLLRGGHPFVDGVEALIRADDRGAAFAMWRHIPEWREEPRLFFRFDFVVEAELTAAARVVQAVGGSLDALHRRAQRDFPIDHSTIWLDADMEPVRSPDIRKLLELPYTNKKPRPDGSVDVNLRLERWMRADALAPTSDWTALCLRARRAAESALRCDPAFVDRCRRYTQRSLEAAARALDILRSRVARLSGAAQAAEERALDFEDRLAHAVAEGIGTPSICADTVGAIFLAAAPMGGE